MKALLVSLLLAAIRLADLLKRHTAGQYEQLIGALTDPVKLNTLKGKRPEATGCLRSRVLQAIRLRACVDAKVIVSALLHERFVGDVLLNEPPFEAANEDRQPIRTWGVNPTPARSRTPVQTTAPCGQDYLSSKDEGFSRRAGVSGTVPEVSLVWTPIGRNHRRTHERGLGSRHYPRRFKAGSVVEEMVPNIDLAPTLLDLAGVAIPDEMQGRSWKTLAAGEPPTPGKRR